MSQVYLVNFVFRNMPSSTRATISLLELKRMSNRFHYVKHYEFSFARLQCANALRRLFLSTCPRIPTTTYATTTTINYAGPPPPPLSSSSILLLHSHPPHRQTDTQSFVFPVVAAVTTTLASSHNVFMMLARFAPPPPPPPPFPLTLNFDNADSLTTPPPAPAQHRQSQVLANAYRFLAPLLDVARLNRFLRRESEFHS